jgi:hypothetical protein
MKKVFSIIALSAMTLSLSSFDTNTKVDAEFFSCQSDAQAVGEFMDGHNGRSGAYYALQFYTTFCLHQQ